MRKKIFAVIALAIGLFGIYSLFSRNTAIGVAIFVSLVVVGLYLLGRAEEKKEAAQNTLNTSDTGLYGNISNDKEFDFEQAKNIRGEMLVNGSPNEASLDINLAAGLMLEKDFEGCIRAYERIMEKYPERKGTCLGQIGVAEFFLGNYEKALERYIESKDFGEDNDMTEDNIWEVCQVLYDNKKDKESVKRYIALYPQGRYAKKAIDLVS